jgi:hypothetical protein
MKEIENSYLTNPREPDESSSQRPKNSYLTSQHQSYIESSNPGPVNTSSTNMKESKESESPEEATKSEQDAKKSPKAEETPLSPLVGVKPKMRHEIKIFVGQVPKTWYIFRAKYNLLQC